jgi:DNA polymerase-1
VADVQHYAALLDDHRKRFSLDVLAKDFLGGYRVERLNESQMATYHAATAAPRARHQVELVHELSEIFLPKLKQEDLMRVVALENDVIYAAAEMEKNGSLLNVELLHQWCDETQRELSRCCLSVSKSIGHRFDPNKTESWIQLFSRYNIPITEYTDKGAPSFEDVTLKKIQNDTVQLARRAKRISSLRSKFLLSYKERVGAGGLLRYELNQLKSDEGGTVTGRFSSKNVNIQQVSNTKKQALKFGSEEWPIRELFIAPAGEYVFAADAKQIEFRLFAHFSKSPRLLKAYQDDPDMSFHVFVGDIIKKVKPDVSYGKTKDTNFAKVYNAGKDQVAFMLELPRAESDIFVDLYDREFPEVKRLNRLAMDRAQARGYVKSILGRRSRFPYTRELFGKSGPGEFYGDERYRVHKALNSVIQPSAADIMKLKMVEAHRLRKEMGFTPRMTVHDELGGSIVSKEGAAELAELLDAQSVPCRVPILWDAKIGMNWKECD